MNEKTFIPSKEIYTSNDYDSLCKEYNISKETLFNILLKHDYVHTTDVMLLTEKQDGKLDIVDECFMRMALISSKKIIDKRQKSPNEYKIFLDNKSNDGSNEDADENKTIFQFIFYTEYLKLNLSRGLLINECNDDIIYSTKAIDSITKRINGDYFIVRGRTKLYLADFLKVRPNNIIDHIIIRINCIAENIPRYEPYIPDTYLGTDDAEKIERICTELEADTEENIGFHITEEFELFLMAMQILDCLHNKKIERACFLMPEFFMNYSRYYLKKTEKRIKTAQSLGAPQKTEKAYFYGKLYNEKCMEFMKKLPAHQAQKKAKEFVMAEHLKNEGKKISERQIQRYESKYLKQKETAT